MRTMRGARGKEKRGRTHKLLSDCRPLAKSRRNVDRRPFSARQLGQNHARVRLVGDGELSRGEDARGARNVANVEGKGGKDSWREAPSFGEKGCDGVALCCCSCLPVVGHCWV